MRFYSKINTQNMCPCASFVVNTLFADMVVFSIHCIIMQYGYIGRNTHYTGF